MYITVKFIQINAEKSTITRSPSSRMNNLVYKKNKFYIYVEVKLKSKSRNQIVIPTAFPIICKYIVLVLNMIMNTDLDHSL